MQLHKYTINKLPDGKQQTTGAADQLMPMAAAQPTPERAASTATVMEAASGARTFQKICQKIMQIMHGRRPPCARNKRISIRRFKGFQLWYPTHQNVSRKGVLHIKLCDHPAKCPNDVMTQFWRQRARMQCARWHTVLAPTRARIQDARYGTAEANMFGWRGARPTHMFWLARSFLLASIANE